MERSQEQVSLRQYTYQNTWFSMKTFIRGMEVWLPQSNATLVLGDTFYGHSLVKPATDEPQKHLAYGEGLAGSVWANGRGCDLLQ